MALAGVSSASAAALGSITVHGSVSATAAVSDRYNYLGDTKGSPSINTVEAIINASRRFNNGVGVSAQLYAYEWDNYSDVVLDFAAVDYTVNEQLAVRLGRIKRPGGLFGDVQDLDIVRPFAFLPLDFYQKTLRPITASYDGAAVSGTFSLGAAGSLDYQAGYGYLPPVASDSPYLRQALQASLNNVDSFDGDTTSSAWLFWNTPVEGLRVGYSHNRSADFTLSGPMKTAAEMALAPGNSRLVPLAFPPGVWDLMLAGRPGLLDGDQVRETLSAEYVRGDWEFIAEYAQSTSSTTARYPAPIGTAKSRNTSESYYGMVTWQATRQWQLGAYYGEGYGNRDDRQGRTLVAVPRHLGWLKDTCAAVSYRATDYWLIKAEAHLLDGTLGLSAQSNGDAARWKSDWSYVVLKSTISF